MAKLLSHVASKIRAASAEGEDIDDYLSNRDKNKSNRRDRSFENLVHELKMALIDINEKDASAVKEFLSACMQHGSRKVIDKFALPVLETKDVVCWQDHDDIICLILDAMLKVGKPWNKYTRRHTSEFVDTLLLIIKRNGHTRTVQPKILQIIQYTLQHAINEGQSPLPIQDSFQRFVSAFNWRDNYKDAINTLHILRRLIKENPRLKRNDICKEFMQRLCETESVRFLLDINEAVAEIFTLCTKQHLKQKERRTNCYQMLEDIMYYYLDRHSSPKLAAPMMPDVKRLWKCGDSELEKCAQRVILSHCGTYELVDDITDILLDMALSGENTSHIRNLSKLYPQCPDIFHSRFDEFVYALRAAGPNDQNSLLDLLWSIAKLHPEEFTPKSLVVIAECLDDDCAGHMAVQVLKSVAEYQPEMVYCHIKDVKDFVEKNGDMGIGALQLFVPLSSADQDRAVDCLEFLASTLESITSTYKPTVMYYMRTIGLEWPDVLAEHKSMFDKLKKVPTLRDSCSSVLDIIDGRSLGNVAQVVSEQQQNIEQLGNRLTETGDNLENMAKELDALPMREPLAEELSKETDRDILLHILTKLNTVEDIHEKVTKIESRMAKMEKRLRNVESSLSELSAREATSV